MSIPEEAGKVANSIVESLKSTPVLLALVIFNVLYLGFGFYSQQGERATNRELVAELAKSSNVERDRWKELVETAMKWCPATEVRR